MSWRNCLVSHWSRAESETSVSWFTSRFVFPNWRLFWDDQAPEKCPLGPSWDDSMMNLSHKARLMPPWYQREKLLLVPTPTLPLVQHLKPKSKAWFFSTFKWIQCRLVSAPKCSRSLSYVHMVSLRAGGGGGDRTTCAASRLWEGVRLLHQLASTLTQMCHGGCYKGLCEEEEATVLCCSFGANQQAAALIAWV